MLSKLACGINKPQKQTILSMSSVPELFTTIPIRKVRHLGGKLGKSLIEEQGLEFMSDLNRLSKQVCIQFTCNYETEILLT